MVTDTANHKHRQDRLQYTAPLASAQCNNNFATWDTGIRGLMRGMATLPKVIRGC